MRKWIGTLLAAAMLSPVAAEAQRRPGPAEEARMPNERGAGRENREGEFRGGLRGGVRGGFQGDARGGLPGGDRPDAAPRPMRGFEGRGDDRDVGGAPGDWRDRRLPDRAARPDGGWRPDRDRDAPGATPAPDRRNVFEGRRDTDRRYGWNDGRGPDRRDGGWDRPGRTWSGRGDSPRVWRSDRNDGRGEWRGGWSGSRRGWDRGWRDDGRYDWSRYRGTNRQQFRLPRYYAPYDWNYGYRRFRIGASLSGGLWGRNYWIADPFAYRLPEAWGPYRWVRYYDDALLVDIDTGEVVDAVYGIFW